MEEDVTADLQTAALFVLSFLGLISNGFIFLLLYKKRNMRTFSNRFVLSLTSSHLLQCIFIIPTMMVSIQGKAIDKIWCKFTASLTVCLNLASVLSILLIAVDRNCAVNSPLHYTITITKRRTGLLIGTIWLVAILFSLPVLVGVIEVSQVCLPVKGHRIAKLLYSITTTFVGFFIPLLSVSCLYFAMFRAAETNNARTRRNSSNSSVSNDVIVNLKPAKKLGVNEYSLRRNYSSDHVEPNEHACCFIGKHKAAVTGLLVVMSFIVCWLPFFLTLISEAFLSLPEGVWFGSNIAAFSSCIINPYLYFFRNKNTWKQAKKLIGRTFSRKDQVITNKKAKQAKIDMSPCVFSLPNSISQTVLTSPKPLQNSFSNHSSPGDMGPRSVVIGSSHCTKIGIFSVDPAKPLLHQDSSSSNDSSDMCLTTVMMGSGFSIDEDSTLWYQPFQTRYSEESMTEIPLDGTAVV